MYIYYIYIYIYMYVFTYIYSNQIVEAEAQKHHYLGSTSAIFLWNYSNKFLYILQQTPWLSSSLTPGMSFYISCR